MKLGVQQLQVVRDFRGDQGFLYSLVMCCYYYLQLNCCDLLQASSQIIALKQEMMLSGLEKLNFTRRIKKYINILLFWASSST